MTPHPLTADGYREALKDDIRRFIAHLDDMTDAPIGLSSWIAQHAYPTACYVRESEGSNAAYITVTTRVGMVRIAHGNGTRETWQAAARHACAFGFAREMFD